MAQTVMEGFGKANIPGIYLVDYFPILKHVPSWVPGTAAKRLAEHYAPYVVSSREKPYEEVKQAIVSVFFHYFCFSLYQFWP